jgi:non-homologous end joining protein Ku|tara:strand:- start:12830 stop:13057 length:228 start_codon:yes stop_codon:yes gene_type:complete
VRVFPATDAAATLSDAKIAGEEIVAPAVEAPPKVVNLMEALKKSLDSVSTGKKKAASASLPRVASRAPARRRARG